MPDHGIRNGTAVVLKVTTAGVLNGHGEVHANTKSQHGTIHTKVPSARGAENFAQAESSRRLSCMDGKLPVCLLFVVGFMHL
jgi:hypothetical protein